jgi:hypothetical protein
MPFFVLARRNDEVISRYFEELQRRQRGKGPENYMTNFCSRGLGSCESEKQSVPP